MDAKDQKLLRLGEVKSLCEPDSCSDEVSGATDINYKNMYNHSGHLAIKRSNSYPVIDKITRNFVVVTSFPRVFKVLGGHN